MWPLESILVSKHNEENENLKLIRQQFHNYCLERLLISYITYNAFVEQMSKQAI